MDFKKFIGENHPDPDSLLLHNFEQMCILAEKYAESLQLRKADVMARFSSEYLHTSIKNLLFAKQYEQLTFDEKMKELMQLLYYFEQEQWEQGFKNGYNASIKDSQKNYDERFSK